MREAKNMPEKKKSGISLKIAAVFLCASVFMGTGVSASEGIDKTEVSAREILGEHVKLEVSVSDRDAVYTCPNGYVRADLSTGEAVEWAVCCPRGEDRLSPEECADKALAFLEERRSGDWRVSGISPSEGFAEIDAERPGEAVRMTVRRDSGTVCFFLLLPDPGGGE